jgi:hypothetical protein
MEKAKTVRIGAELISALGAILAVMFAITLAACSGDERAIVQPQHRVAPVIQAGESLDEALAELEELKCPEGVDEELWGELKDVLEEALEARASSVGRGFIPRRDSSADDAAAARKGPPYSDGIRFVSMPPGDRVNDLALTDHYDTTYTLSWSYRNLGDYD